MAEPVLEDKFDPSKQKIFCSYCGSQLREMGHMFSIFMLCPVHGEFTPSPLVIKKESGDWFIRFHDLTERSSWESCKVISEIKD